ncbi:PepSY domain-containing protein [Curvibacter sp. RS43]|uniref:PepSY-associated TM helix domain-containing protein n=1 Tax=Curvibacter microcysteis TaxID=3026419 RepID=UPI0023608FC6|nr:PepSY domain-containing protein [Curvibacter sp. RS43]MDD0812480.1 PepSY domain-containing protein [Curvibacter sp. RS43]
MARVRILVRQGHLWLGLSVGALLLVLGLTGSVLVFYQEIDRWLHPEIAQPALGPAPGWDSPVWSQALHTLQRQWPERQGLWRFEVSGEPGPLAVRYQEAHSGHHAKRVMVWLSADGQQVLRADTWGDYLMTWIYDLHMALQMGDEGRRWVGWAGLASSVLLLSGLAAWWPQGRWRQAFQYKRGAPPIRSLRDLHKLAGVFSLFFLLLLTLTGWMLAWPNETRSVLTAVWDPVATLSPPSVSPSSAPVIPLEQALQRAHERMPQSRLAWFEVPGGAGGRYMVRVQQPGDPSDRFPHSYVFMDPHSGEVLAQQDRNQFGTSNRILNWLHPLHDGSAGGLGGRLLVCGLGFIPALLWLTGLWRWRLVRQANARGAARRPDQRPRPR